MQCEGVSERGVKRRRAKRGGEGGIYNPNIFQMVTKKVFQNINNKPHPNWFPRERQRSRCRCPSKLSDRSCSARDGALFGRAVKTGRGGGERPFPSGVVVVIVPKDSQLVVRSRISSWAQ